MAKDENTTRLPSVDVLLRGAAFSRLVETYGHSAVRGEIRAGLDELRQRFSAQVPRGDLEGLAAQVTQVLLAQARPTLKPVFNLTGTILHTNLGRAPLAESAIAAMVAAAGAVNLEFDLETGGRGQRDDHLARLIQDLTGAKAAIAVNNNAAAVMIALNSLAQGSKVLVSRGELIEIGGAFRMPDIMASSGAILHEVGTTNRTHLRDFETAIGPDTAMILKVHTSNYVVQGFTKTVPEPELAALAKKHNIPFVVDLGSGTLVDLARFGLPHEVTVRETLDHGADLVTFSGDKLLGGPQAGIIAGRAELVAQIAANPMKRAMRLDKITLAALGATLRLYDNPDSLAARLPVLGMLSRGADDIQNQAARLQPKIAAIFDGTEVEIIPCKSQIGSGALPVDLLDSTAIALKPGGGDKAARDLLAALRNLPIPVIARLNNGQIFLDLRALTDETEFLKQLPILTQAGPFSGG